MGNDANLVVRAIHASGKNFAVAASLYSETNGRILSDVVVEASNACAAQIVVARDLIKQAVDGGHLDGIDVVKIPHTTLEFALMLNGIFYPNENTDEEICASDEIFDLITEAGARIVTTIHRTPSRTAIIAMNRARELANNQFEKVGTEYGTR